MGSGKVIEAAVDALNRKLTRGFDGVAKFKIADAGAIIVDSSGARAGDDEADVTLTADRNTFQDILEGNLDPASAFMSGRLAVDGNIGTAMKLGSALS
ncbi:MAG: SCP2 sterol-binding domain-containing protein [Roseovarius sp.]|nr:SCP2 sterol-binding domain-containing protein [Roseovarius sp.]MCY4208474.1 SCP2 sterol-binding domain-containing protein [Roseovarius sp.]MCY4292585.1 SCP2 sterol-binding domain-containing protein [Roseovarius sp.]MCY4315133.1 SCP2 sterol-binding domain-containing protein [Roseovarius sp.]